MYKQQFTLDFHC